MHAALDPSVSAKLAKVCGLLGSDHDGERAAAAAAATRILRDAGVSWSELLSAGAAPPDTPATTPATAHPQEIAREILLRQRHLLSAWEVGFTENLARWRGRPTPRQIARLARLRADLGTRKAGR